MSFPSLLLALQKLPSTDEGPGTQVPRAFPWVIIGFFLLDVIVVGKVILGMLVLRLFWGLCLLGYPRALAKASAWQARLLALFHGALAGGSCVALVIFAGGFSGPYIALIPGWQLVVTLLYQRGLIELLTSGVVCASGTFLLMLHEGRTLHDASIWALMVLSCTFFGLYCCAWLLKMHAAVHEARLERTRSAALEALAVSERRRTQAEKLALIGRIAAGVMHEINNPLAYVRSNIDFLQKELAQTPLDPRELAEVLAETRSGVEHIQRIVMDLKGFSSMETEEPSECVLADVVGEAVKMASLRIKHVAHLKVDVPAELPKVLAVRRKLTQVVLNLLVNAGDALEEHRVADGEVRVSAQAEGPRVRLTVEDNGPGFTPQVLAQLFDSFFTTKGPERGTGLGLALSRELVEQFGGVLSAGNRPEGGARLCIELPIQPDGSLARPVPASSEAQVGVT